MALIFSDSELALCAETTNNTLHRTVMRIDHARLKVLTMVILKIQVLLEVKLCSLVNSHQPCEGL